MVLWREDINSQRENICTHSFVLQETPSLAQDRCSWKGRISRIPMFLEQGPAFMPVLFHLDVERIDGLSGVVHDVEHDAFLPTEHEGE